MSSLLETLLRNANSKMSVGRKTLKYNPGTMLIGEWMLIEDRSGDYDASFDVTGYSSFETALRNMEREIKEGIHSK